MSLAVSSHDGTDAAPDACQARAGIHALPVELLQAIFLTIANAPDPCWASLETATYNTTRARAPYCVSGVCQHWRRVALGIADLWTYVALPPHRGPSRNVWWDAARPSLQGHLERSRSRGLSIVLIPDEDTASSSSTADDSAERVWFLNLLIVLADEAARWERVKIQFPPCLLRQAFSPVMVSRALPRLAELGLASAPGVEYGELDAPWLAHAPALHELCVAGIEFYPPASGLKSVRRATYAVAQNHAYDALWTTLARLPALRALTLQLDCDVHTPAVPVELRRLEALTVRGENQSEVEQVVAAHIAAPALRTLCVKCTPQRFVQPWGRAYAAVFPGITDLEVERAELRCEDTAALGGLRRLRHVRLVDCVFPLEGSRCAQNNFFSQLDGVWPALESLAIVGLPERDGAVQGRNRPYGDETVQRIAFFVRARHERLQLSLSNWPTPFPPWFRRVLGMLLGPQYVHLSTSDGAVHSVFLDEGDVEPLGDQDEAEFTDSDSSGAASSDYNAGEVGDRLGRWSGRTLNGPEWESDSDDSEYVDEVIESEPQSMCGPSRCLQLWHMSRYGEPASM